MIDPTDRTGQVLDKYRLLRLLGRGGFADVYLAQHIRLGSYAAIKILHPHMHIQANMQSFEREAQTLAQLRNPHIMRVFDLGTDTYNSLYLVMDHAPQGSLRTRHPEGSVVPLETVVSYVKQVANALQHAHDAKIIHRDVKPENMLVGHDGEIILSDFGLAAVAHSKQSLRTQGNAGTIDYMPKEQINGRPEAASDQYALAITVYEWLCGTRPFTGEMWTELALKHVMEEPQPLRKKVSDIPMAVEQVVLKALAKDASQRYGSVREFAEALERASKRVVPIGTTLAVCVGHTSAVWSVPWSPDGSRLASASADQTVRIWDATSGTLLLSCIGHTSGVGSVRWSPNGRYLASVSKDKTVCIWDATIGKRLFTCSEPSEVYSVAWSPDGRRFATGSYDQVVRIWDATTAKHLLTCSGHTHLVYSVAWSPDGGRLASVSQDRSVRVWDAATGRQVLMCSGHTNAVGSVAWSPDGRQLATASDDCTVRIWDATTAKHLLTCSGHTHVVYSVAWSPDGRQLASASDDHTVCIWDATTGRCLYVYREHKDHVLAVAWSPDSTRVASGGDDYMVRVWQAV